MTERTPSESASANESRAGRESRWLLVPAAVGAVAMTGQLWSVTVGRRAAARPARTLSTTLEARLSPTTHAPVPPTLEAMWYARAERTLAAGSDLAGLARGVKMLDESGDAAAALPLVSARRSREDRRRRVRALLPRDCPAALESVGRSGRGVRGGGDDAMRRRRCRRPRLFRQAEIREARNDFAGAVAIYERLLQRKLASPQIALVKLAAAASAAGDAAKSIAAARRVLTEFSLSAEAAEAEMLLDRLGAASRSRRQARSRPSSNAPRRCSRRASGTRRGQRTNGSSGKTAGADGERLIFRLAQIQAATGQLASGPRGVPPLRRPQRPGRRGRLRADPGRTRARDRGRRTRPDPRLRRAAIRRIRSPKPR